MDLLPMRDGLNAGSCTRSGSGTDEGALANASKPANQCSYSGSPSDHFGGAAGAERPMLPDAVWYMLEVWV